MASTTVDKPTNTTNPDGRPAPRGEVSRRDTGPLTSEHGVTQIADVVVQKIAGLAARDVSGVRSLGGGAARAFGAIRERIPGAGTSHGQGVTVEVGERQAAVDLEVLVEYGVAIPELARAIRRNVITAIERMTGLEVVEVNINVNDVAVDTEDGDAGTAPSRVE